MKGWALHSLRAAASYLKLHSLELAVVTWAMLAPVHPALACAVVFPLVDMLLAVVVTIRQKRAFGVRAVLAVVESSKLGRTAAKILIYLSGICLAFAAETYLGVPFAIRVMTGIVGTRELKSCLEHLDTLSGGELFKKALDRLASTAKDDNDRGSST